MNAEIRDRCASCASARRQLHNTARGSTTTPLALRPVDGRYNAILPQYTNGRGRLQLTVSPRPFGSLAIERRNGAETVACLI